MCGEERAAKAAQDPRGGNDQREHQGRPTRTKVRGRSSHNQGGARGLGEGAKQIGAHTSDVTHVVTHVVGDDTRVTGIVLGNSFLHLADQVCADISGLGVDTTAHTTEHGDGRATQPVTRDGVHEHLSHLQVGVLLVEDAKRNEQDKQCQAGQSKAHDRAGTECQSKRR